MCATIVEKILARAAGRPAVRVGEILDVVVDRLFINDFVGPIAIAQFESLELPMVLEPDRILFGLDHRVPPADVKSANNHIILRSFCKKYNIKRLHDIGRHGIGHQLMVEGFTLPGEISLGTDSHATMYGGVGAFACGITSSDAAVIMATGKIWLQVPPSIRINIFGELQTGVTAKDLSLAMIKLVPLNTLINKAIELGGSGLEHISISGRLVLANMAAEMGVKCAIVQADKKNASYLGCLPEEIFVVKPDTNAKYESVYELDANKVEPLVACPHSVENIVPVSQVAGTKVHQVFLGSCTNGRIEDFEQALEILDGRQVHKDVRLLVVPASQDIMLEATRKGYIEKFLTCGAAIMTPSCASCAGAGAGLIGDGERAVSTTNRNFKGRMGSINGEVYLSSAYVAAAAAVKGELCDPRDFLSEEANS
jgi:3-isopropylmalate/(R)-2-methylmalate dehydratase large subunit